MRMNPTRAETLLLGTVLVMLALALALPAMPQPAAHPVLGAYSARHIVAACAALPVISAIRAAFDCGQNAAGSAANADAGRVGQAS